MFADSIWTTGTLKLVLVWNINGRKSAEMDKFYALKLFIRLFYSLFLFIKILFIITVHLSSLFITFFITNLFQTIILCELPACWHQQYKNLQQSQSDLDKKYYLV